MSVFSTSGRLRSVIMCACTFAFLAVPAYAQRRVALVIGNSQYQHAGVLANPSNDASDMALALEALGFTVISGVDGLTKSEMDTKIREFSAALSGADISLLFYAGHGLQFEGNNYLLPIDAQLTNPAALHTEAVRLDTIQAVMEGQTKQSILFFDACRNNPFAQSLSRGGGRAWSPGLALQSFRVGTLIAFSAQPGATASDGVGRNSPFAGPLVQQLRRSSDDLVTILMLVRKQVLTSTNGEQVPWNQDSLLDKIFLNGSSVAAASSPSATPVTTAAVTPRATLHSVWSHNQSELLLLSAGDRRAFYYKRPSPAVAEAGVKEGTLLFEGRVVGDQYVGTAYRFSTKCPARAYQVSGPIGDGGRAVSMKGQVRRLDSSNCTLKNAYTDELEFNYLRSE